jgi:anti-sigma B factor antagonist
MSIIIKKDPKNNSVICRIDGEININSVPRIKIALNKFIAKKIQRITIDFSKITYIDSSGLAMLIEALKEIRLYGGSLELANFSPRIKNIFEIKKLDKLFTIIANANSRESNSNTRE